MLRPCRIAVVSGVLLITGSGARADIDPLSGIDFARIGSPGNAPWMGNGQLGDTAIGRGSVGYEYSMGRFEVTTAQWSEFMNAAFDRPSGDSIPHVNSPALWGAVPTTAQNGGVRWTVPAGNEMIPVGGVSWRTSAIYCNWLSNGKSLDRAAFLNGAYDVGTFGPMGNGFSDQVTHNPGARYWIPTWDEYLKAAHFDPNRFGAGQPGWWIENSTIGHLAAPGLPPTGEANYGTAPTTWVLPLGSYPNVQSAWGLFDLAGATTEWTERVFTSGGRPAERGYAGSWWGSNPNAVLADTIYFSLGSTVPQATGFQYGFRVASSVPAPTSTVAFAGVFIAYGVHIRRRRPCGQPSWDSSSSQSC